MKTLVVGGGPGGLYLALLLKQADPGHEVTVVERNAPGVTFGWGVVFSDETLGYLAEHDEPSYREISDRFARWDAIEVRVRGEIIRSGGHGFSGIAQLHRNREIAPGGTAAQARDAHRSLPVRAPA